MLRHKAITLACKAVKYMQGAPSYCWLTVSWQAWEHILLPKSVNMEQRVLYGLHQLAQDVLLTTGCSVVNIALLQTLGCLLFSSMAVLGPTLQTPHTQESTGWLYYLASNLSLAALESQVALKATCYTQLLPGGAVHLLRLQQADSHGAAGSVICTAHKAAGMAGVSSDRDTAA